MNLNYINIFVRVYTVSMLLTVMFIFISVGQSDTFLPDRIKLDTTQAEIFKESIDFQMNVTFSEGPLSPLLYFMIIPHLNYLLKVIF